MKKVIAIAIVVAVAFVGLTSYNGSGEKKEKKGLFAEVKTGGSGGSLTNTQGSTKRVD
ncbi:MULTISPECIES: hypothetical protein [unclassified Flavobacterium]|uniref:hypothetical protein n=1 Tax=unclassified Flavobacterium TaxID=196869 RepID=UPI001F1383EA|nr:MULTISPECIES: hypothetical protein [unclassified Flavobacterium]UMY66516.1 hypothetical protein MKO97_03795 [Flavobacterium sp. HJ-32-4]